MGIFSADEITHTSGSGLIGQQGPAGVGFILTDNGDYDIQSKKMVNVKQGTNPDDAVTKSQIQLLEGAQPGTVINDKAVIYNDTGSVHRNSVYLQDTPGGAGNSNDVRLLSEHQSYENIHLHIPDLQNFDGFGGRPKSEIMVTSTEQHITGRKTFFDINVLKPDNNYQVANKGYVDTALSTKADLQKTDTQTFKSRIKIPDCDPQAHSSSDIVNMKFMNDTYLNRRTGGTLYHSITFLPTISVNQRQIHNIASPQFNSSAANKSYVDSEIAKVSGNIDSSPYLKKDDNIAMAGNLNLGNKQITNIANPTSNDQAVNKYYVDHNFLNRLTPNALGGYLDIRGHLITHHGTPSNQNDVVNTQYVDSEIAKIPSG